MISTHAPRTGSDATVSGMTAEEFKFQPTLPARGATDVSLQVVVYSGLFQPTLPARGATALCLSYRAIGCEFQPTLPARGATEAGRRPL